MVLLIGKLGTLEVEEREFKFNASQRCTARHCSNYKKMLGTGIHTDGKFHFKPNCVSVPCFLEKPRTVGLKRIHSYR